MTQITSCIWLISITKSILSSTHYPPKWSHFSNVVNLNKATEWVGFFCIFLSVSSDHFWWCPMTSVQLIPFTTSPYKVAASSPSITFCDLMNEMNEMNQSLSCSKWSQMTKSHATRSEVLLLVIHRVFRGFSLSPPPGSNQNYLCFISIRLFLCLSGSS